MSHHDTARAIADLVTSKQAAYGDAYGKAPRLLEVLYPDGIPVSAYPDALALVRVLDKLCRLAHGVPDDAESPWLDIAGYALLSLEDR